MYRAFPLGAGRRTSSDSSCGQGPERTAKATTKPGPMATRPQRILPPQCGHRGRYSRPVRARTNMSQFQTTHVTQAIAACTTRQSPRYVEVEGSRTEGGGALPPPATGSTSRGPWEELRSSQGVSSGQEGCVWFVGLLVWLAGSSALVLDS